MNKKRILEAGVSLLLGVGVATASYAYEESTHVIITADAVSRSNLTAEASILADIGLSPLGSAVYVPPTGGQPLTAPGMIQYGADVEDYVNLPQHIARVFNHFYDVQYNGYAGRGLTQYGQTIGIPSPDWALEDRGNVAAIEVDLRNIPFLELEEEYLQYGGMLQTNSFRHAQEAYYEVLTGREPAYRQAQAAQMFQSLGGVVHHLQDMAQPQHVRNERHNDMPLSYYEFYTEAYVNQRLPAFLANTYPIPMFDTARQLWYSVQSSADHLPRNVGMAEFTSNNFITATTGYIGNNGTVLPSTAYALPNGLNADGTRKTIESQPYSITYANGITETDTADFVIGTVQDALPIPAVSAAPRRLAMSSLLDRGTGRYAGFRAFTVSPAVFEAGYPVLLPRASAFSSGLINHFFRGRLNLARGAGNTGWLVTNTSRSGQTMQGVLKLFYENSLGNRYAVANGAFTINLAAGAAQTLNVEPPSDTTKVIAAFGGRIGSEGDPSGTGFFAVAGKVIAYSVPTLPCSGSTSYYGSTTAWEETMNLGSVSGPVEVELEAYDVPDRLDIRRTNAFGATLWTTGGLVSGFRKQTFQHTGTQDPVQNRINIKLTPNPTSYTVWVVTVGCPNEALDNADRAKQRIKVSFDVVKPTGFCNQGEIKYFLDGANVGTLQLPGGGSTFPGIDATLGPTHRVSATISIPNPVFGCGGILKMRYFDREGAHEFNSGGSIVEFK